MTCHESYTSTLGNEDIYCLYLRWNVLDVYGNSTSQPIVFIVGMKTRRKNGTEYPWGVLGNVNMSLTALFTFDFSKCKNNNKKQTNKHT